MLLIDTKMLPFQATAFVPGEKDFVTLDSQSMIGKWNIFFFYPADFTYVCPTELEDLADYHDELKSMGVDVYAVSTDSHFCHKAWHDSSEAVGKINYTMISDNTFQISKNFGVLRENEGRSERGTFIVDPDGVIKSMEISCEGIGRDASSLVRKVKAAQYVREHPDEVCPAKWEEGEETLAPSLDLVGRI
ncbi:MAG: peroxiredoxin [Rhodospirillaceae bacterium]|nr:peroxiredoxin [Rhodospirillaceae bacterium]|tara:strand:- start:3027 stop:3596 length:570 start_codon:yes stop_codon:yes gene_type:complete